MNELAKAAHFFFERNHSQAIRIIEKGDTRWFVVKDVCEILGIKNSRDALKDIPENERNTVGINDGIHRGRGNPNMSIVNEAGLYRLVFKSRKPEAERFKTWVFEEVLPSIRKYGFYRASLPKIWPHRGKELTWGECVNKKGERSWERWEKGEKSGDRALEKWMNGENGGQDERFNCN